MSMAEAFRELIPRVVQELCPYRYPFVARASNNKRKYDGFFSTFQLPTTYN